MKRKAKRKAKKGKSARTGSGYDKNKQFGM